jgi:predicted lipase
MSTFDPQYAHDVLIPIAEAAYDNNLPIDLPSNFSVVGQIVVDPAKVAMALAAAVAGAAAPHMLMIQRMRASGDGFGWVVENKVDHTLVICFRGTQSAEDWLHDFDFLPSAYEPVANYGTVHKGFQEVYKVVRGSVFNLLGRADKGFTRLIVSGHSLGAAVSELAAPDLLQNGGITLTPEVQNFAGPRAGHHDFASIFDVQIDVCFRVVNTWDIVPRLPPPLALFEHVGLAVHVDGGFTLDELVAHSMDKSYAPGLAKLIPLAATQMKTASAAALSLSSDMMIGREP